jgi:hypothetical protein
MFTKILHFFHNTVKLKLPLLLITTLYICTGRAEKDPHILKLKTKRKWFVSIRLWRIYTLYDTSQCYLDGRFVGCHRQSDLANEEIPHDRTYHRPSTLFQLCCLSSFDLFHNTVYINCSAAKKRNANTSYDYIPLKFASPCIIICFK